MRAICQIKFYELIFMRRLVIKEKRQKNVLLRSSSTAAASEAEKGSCVSERKLCRFSKEAAPRRFPFSGRIYALRARKSFGHPARFGENRRPWATTPGKSRAALGDCSPMPFDRARDAPSGQESHREGGDYPAYRAGRDDPQPCGEVCSSPYSIVRTRHLSGLSH